MPRAFWKGYLKLSFVSCAIALYPAVTRSERPRFHRIHRQTGRRLRQQMVESETLEAVPVEDIGRDYKVAPLRSAVPPSRQESRLPPQSYEEPGPSLRNRAERAPAARSYVEIEDEELQRIEIVNTHTIDIEHFVPRGEIDDRYLNTAYYAAPTDEAGYEAYAVIRDAMNAREMAALARVVLARREHAVMVEPFGKGLLAVTLHYPYEIRDEASYFETIPDLDLPKEMKDLALHIVARMESRFDPSKIEDRYKTALDELIASKASARVIETVRNAPTKAGTINLMDALKASVAAAGKPKRRPRR